MPLEKGGRRSTSSTGVGSAQVEAQMGGSDVWRSTHLDFGDALNRTLWAESVDLEQALRRSGAIAGLTSTQGDSGVPWVPDLVGRKWRRPGGALIFGSAYAPFEGEDARRKSKLDKRTTGREPVEEWQRRFFHRIVERDDDYYGPVAKLVGRTLGDLSRCVLSDLVRASVVAEVGRAYGDRVMRAHRSAFLAYAKANWAWTKKRLRACRGRTLIALGALAEEELVRLLVADGWTASLDGAAFMPETIPRGSPFLHETLGCRVDRGMKWLMRSPDGEEWWLIPVFHPAATWYWDKGYGRSCASLAAHWNGVALQDARNSFDAVTPERRDTNGEGGPERPPRGGLARGAHYVCHNSLHVRWLDSDRFESGYWVIDERHLPELQYVALHENQRERSYLQGKVIGWRHAEHGGKLKTVFEIEKWEGGIDWAGATGQGGHYVYW